MLTTLDADPSVHVMVITGNEKVCRRRRHRRDGGMGLRGWVYNDNYITRHWEAAKVACR